MVGNNYWDEFEYSKLKLLLNNQKVTSILDVANGKKYLDTHFPISVELHLTDNCNLKCEWCTDKELRKNAATLPLDTIHKLFQEFSISHTGVTLEGGGEPTLHPQFREVINLGHENNIDMGLITNGTIDISDCVHKLKWTRVSLDSSCKEEYINEKGVDCFERVLNHLKKMSEVRNPSKTYIGVGYVLTNRNQSHLLELIERLDEIGVDYIYLRPVEEAPDISPTPEELLDLRKRLIEITKDRRIKYKLTIEDRIVDQNNHLPCIAHSLTSIIHANGEVSLCEKRRGDIIILGNVNETSFKDIWNSTLHEQMTQKLLNAECQSICSACRITGFNMMFDGLNKLNTKNFI